MESRTRRSAGSRRPKNRSRGWLLWLLGGLLLVGAFGVAARGGGRTHPEPRPLSERPEPVSARHYAAYPRTAAVYRQVAAAPGVVDGVFCYCYCEEHAGHYSLLDCFSSDHAASCDVCLSEGALAYRMNREGKSLDQIRHAVDQLYGT